MKLSELKLLSESIPKNYGNHIVYHATTLEFLVSILNDGFISPDATIHIDDNGDMIPGDVVYTSKFHTAPTYQYHGIYTPDAIIVLDTSKLQQLSNHDFHPNFEGDLYEIKEAIPLDCFVYILLNGDVDNEDSEHLETIKQMCKQKNIRVKIVHKNIGKNRNRIISHFNKIPPPVDYVQPDVGPPSHFSPYMMAIWAKRANMIIPKFEQKILQDGEAAALYAIDVLKRRWPQAEPAIDTSSQRVKKMYWDFVHSQQN